MSKMRCVKYTFLFFFILQSVEVFGAGPIRYLGIEHGLSNNSVTSITKDSYGYIWIGTYDGLNRYDGQKFRVFRNRWGDQASLGNNHVTAVASLPDQMLTGTQKGLYAFSYSTAKFSILKYKEVQKGPVKLISDNINAMLSDSKDNVFIAADHLGLLLYSKASKYCKRISVSEKGSSINLQAMALDSEGQLFVFIEHQGLYRLADGNSKLLPVDNALHSATSLLFDKNNNRLWIGTENGLYHYDFKDGKLRPFTMVGKSLSSDNITDLKFDQHGNLWIGTNGGGVNILDIKKEYLSFIKPGQQRGTLESGAISSIYIDGITSQWIATLRGGINIVNSERINFKLLKHDPFNQNSVANDFILSFCEDEKRNIWIGTDGGGLTYWNRALNSFTNFFHTDQPGSLQSNFIVSIVKDYVNRIWIASFSGGIDAYDPKTRSFIHYTCYNPSLKTQEKNLWKLFEDSKHNLWAGTTRGGALYRYNRKLDRFEIYDSNLTNVHVIFEDASGRLWVGNYNELINVDPVSKRNVRYNIGYALRTIAQNETNALWIGTEGGGLVRFDLSSKHFRRLTQRDGLPGNSVLNVLVANNGDIWCSTYNGLSHFDIRRRQFNNFGVADGLQSNQFNYNAALKLRSGELLFGGISGFNMFDPDSIRILTNQPRLRVNDIRVNNATIEGQQQYTKGIPIVRLKKLSVPYRDATIAIEYTALEYAFRDKIKFAYYLEGWDHGWNYVGDLQTAYYTHLNEGQYKLHIKASDSQGQWSSEELTMAITILPPWYRTWFAYLIYFLAGSAVSYWVWLYRNRQQKLKYDVQIANLNTERERELNEKKLSFFTNVSHEFRTPLTLIINPIKDLISQNNDDHAELNVIYRNARRLLGLVDHLLLFRKTETENAVLTITKLDFVTICQDVFMCFTHQAKIKKLHYTITTAADNMEIFADREKIELALFNLISNALKYTPDTGNIQVSVSEDNDHVRFEVADSGIGIRPDVGDQLFEKFFRLKDKQFSKSGFGIGLYLVKNFVDSHHGTIGYTSNELGGTTFTMSLLKGYQHFGSEQVDHMAITHTHVNDLIDHDNKELVTEDESRNLELLISDKQTVIVIDDNDQIRGYIKKLLTPDYRVVEANNGQVGLEQIKKSMPDLIISDIVMEGLSGIELCKILKNDNATSHIPIILLTGNATAELMLDSINQGATDFISKPFEKDVFLAKIRSVLRSKKELQNYFYQEITLKNSTRNVSEEHKDFLYRCIAVIESHLTDRDFDVEFLAKQMKISYPTLFKRIKITTGKSINNFIRFVRLRKAAELLIRTNCNINEAAFQVGINDMKYFREQFNKQFNSNPSEFVKKHRANFQISYRID